MMIRRLLAGLGALALLGPAPPAAAAGPWRWPVPSPVVVLRGFEAPSGPYGPGHRGVDLAAPARSAVRAAGAGTVLVAGVVAGRPVVVVAHGAVRSDDELRTTYEPVVATVAVGARVAAGAVIGHLGAWPGHCAQSCLHWGLRRGDLYLDPSTLLAGPVRLLPEGAPVPVADGARGIATTAATGAAAAGRGVRPSAVVAGERPPAGPAASPHHTAAVVLLGTGATTGAALVALRRRRSRWGGAGARPRGSSP